MQDSTNLSNHFPARQATPVDAVEPMAPVAPTVPTDGKPPAGEGDKAGLPEVRIAVREPQFRLPRVVMAASGVFPVLFITYLLYRLMPVVLLIVISLLFATAIKPDVNWLRRGPFNLSAGNL